MIAICLKRILMIEIDIEGRECLLEGLKGIVRELSFAWNPEFFGGSGDGFCGAVLAEERAMDISNVPDS